MFWVNVSNSKSPVFESLQGFVYILHFCLKGFVFLYLVVTDINS